MSYQFPVFRSLARDASAQSKPGKIWQKEHAGDISYSELNGKRFEFEDAKALNYRHKHMERVRYESKLLQENAFLKMQLSQAKIELEELLQSSSNRSIKGPTLFCSLAPKKYVQMSSDASSTSGLFSEAPTIRTGSAKKIRDSSTVNRHCDRTADIKSSCFPSFIYGNQHEKGMGDAKSFCDNSRKKHYTHTHDFKRFDDNKSGRIEGRDDYNHVVTRHKSNKCNYSSRRHVGMKERKSSYFSDAATNPNHHSQYYERKYEEIEANQSRLPVIYESSCNRVKTSEIVEL